ncbi:MAG: AAA family ATPase [Acidobacteria bacterium]|nr:AAA family ATPase [Acidobacteriota bacterium]
MPNETFHFTPFSLDTGVGLLYRDGVPVPLEPRAVKLLAYLVRSRGRVVPKEELLDKVWADVFTTDAVLKQAVSQIRRALGDAADAPRYVQTFHARGYQFIAPVTVGTEETAATTERVASHESDAVETPAAATAHAREEAGPNYDLLVGRENELSLLRAEFGHVLAGGGQPVIIKGEPGIGKTQLARHLGRWARDEQGAAYVYGRFFDYAASRLAPYETFIDLLSGALSFGGRAHAPGELRAAVKARCGVVLPDELFGVEEANAQLVRAASGDHFRIVAPLGKAFLRLSRERPLVMVLDDLQWADEVSLDCLGYLMRVRAAEPLMLVMPARAEEASDPRHALGEWLKRHADYRSFTSIKLQPLGEPAVREAVEEAFGGTLRAPLIPQADTSTVFRVTGGNPYFLVETLRLLVAEGAISVADEADGSSPRWRWNGIGNVPLPDSLVMAALGKLERTPATLRELLEHAAVIGDEFRVETLARMSGRGEDELDESLREGLRLGVLAERGLSFGEDYRFYHTILRRVLYESLSPRRRRRLHLLAAAAIEEVHARHPERLAESLSAHYEAAGDARRAFRWAMRAWAAAAARWHWVEAVKCAERARRAAEQLEFHAEAIYAAGDTSSNFFRPFAREDDAAPLPLSAELSMLLALCESLHAVGRNRELEPVIPEALALARSLNDETAEAAVHFQDGLVHSALSQYREALSAIERSLEIYRRLGDKTRARLAVVHLGRIRASMGDYEHAGELIQAVLDEEGVDEETAADAAGMLGWTRVLQGRYDEGVGLLQKCLEYHARCGNVRLRAQVLRRLHWADLSRGQYESAVALAKRAQKDFQAIGNLFGEAKIYMGLGQARIAQGLYEEGIAYLRRTLESLNRNGDAHCEAETLWLLGRAHCEAGRLSEAEAMLARALEMIRHIGDRDDEFRILVDQARVAVERGEFKLALSKSIEAAKIAAELNCRDGLGFALVEQSRAELGLADVRCAVSSAEVAVRLLEETGSGERWRGYRALALALEAEGGESEASQSARRRTAELLEEIREQLPPTDTRRREEMSRTRRFD